MRPFPFGNPLDVFNTITEIFIIFPERGSVGACPGNGDKGPPLLAGARLPAAKTETSRYIFYSLRPPPLDNFKKVS